MLDDGRGSGFGVGSGYSAVDVAAWLEEEEAAGRSGVGWTGAVAAASPLDDGTPRIAHCHSHLPLSLSHYRCGVLYEALDPFNRPS